MTLRTHAPGRRGRAQVLSDAVATDLKDPRIGFVTVTAVETSPRPSPCPRLRQRARRPTASARRTLDGLRSAHGFLQRRVGARAAHQAHADARVRLRRHARPRACASSELLDREAGA